MLPGANEARGRLTPVQYIEFGFTFEEHLLPDLISKHIKKASEYPTKKLRL